MFGAVGASIWAMTQEPPQRHRPDATPRPAASVQRKADVPRMPKKVETPVQRPSQLVTSSVARAERPVPEKRPDNSLYTTTRVNVRSTANTAAAIVTTLDAGEAVKPILRDGKWQLVSVQGRKGWILGDYLRRSGPDAPRPSQSVPGPTTAKMSPRQPGPALRPQSESSSLLTNVKALFGGEKKPLRAPQEGDCQCPYDLMINGSPCGERSAYSRRSRRHVQCYM
ncbi:SH3 domain-containing protein [Borborobacter arsenicus]|nr:SH3 domain-containing protein [Pseudaminobacter arsenicus]